jgi:hypothetical protein
MQSSRELYRKPSSPRRTRRFDRPPTPPATPLSTSSSSTDDTPTSPHHTSSPISPTSLPFPPSPAPAPHSGPLNSGSGGSRTQVHSAPWQEDQNHNHGQYQIQHHRYMSSSGLDTPYLSRNLQEQSSNSSQRLSYCHRPYHHPYRDHSRRSSNSSSQSHSHPHSQSRSSPITLRPQPYTRHSDLSYDRPGSTATTINHNGVISVCVPPRYPIDDRELEFSLSTSSPSRSHAHGPKQRAPPVLHAPQPIRHPDMLSPRLRPSARA